MNKKTSKVCKPKTRIWTWLSQLILHAKSHVTILQKNSPRFASLCLYLFLCSCPMYYISLRTSACLSVCMILCYLTERFTCDEQPQQQQQKWWRHISLQKKEMLRKKVVCFVWKSVVLCCCYCCIRQRQRRRCCCFFYVMDFSGVVVLLLGGETPSNEFCCFPCETLRKTFERRGNSYNPQWTQWNSCNSLSVCYSSVLPSDQTSSVTPSIWFGLFRFDLTSITETVNFVWAVKV